MAWPVDGSYSAWSTCMRVRSQASKIDAACAWYWLDLADMPPAFWGSVKSDGSDLRFTSADGETAIYHRLIYINSGAETGLVALAQPHGGSGASVDIDSYCYVGNAGATSTESASAWPSSLQALWMMQEPPTSATAILDWSGNTRHSTAVGGSMTSGDLVDGPHSGIKSINFDSNDRALVPSTIFDGAEIANAFTWCAWLYPTDDRDVCGVFGSQGGQFYVRYDYGFYAGLRNSGNSAFVEANHSPYSEDTWYWVAVRYDGATLKLFINGVEKASVVSTSMRSADLNYFLAHDNTSYFDGRMAEVGLYAEAFSVDQIATMYRAATDSAFWAIEEHEGGGGGGGVTGTASAGVLLSASALGLRGLGGVANAAVDMAASATGRRGLFGAARATVDVAATATGFRGLLASARAAIDLAATALGFRGLFGAATAQIDITAHTTDFDGVHEGTALAEIYIGGRAIGYVGTVGPADGRALVPYLTGANATGAPQRDPQASTGGHRSGERCRSMEWDTDDPLVGVSIVEVGGANAQGVGTITAVTADSVTWTAPGGGSGAAVELLPGGEIVAPGANSGAWVRLQRHGAGSLEGAKTIRTMDIYNNLFPDVVTADAIAGLTTTRALMLRNTMGTVRDFRAWVGDCDDPIEIALEVPVDGAISGVGLTWSAPSTAETGLYLYRLAADGEVGLWIRRVLSAATAPSPSREWDVRWQFSDGADPHESAVRGRYRIEREDYIKEGIWVGIGAAPDLNGEPDETWTTTPHTTDLGLSLPATVYAARKKMNKWGMWGVPTDVERYDLDAEGAATLLPPSAPINTSVKQTPTNRPTVGATYEAEADDDGRRAEIWCIWLATDGTSPDGSGEPDGYAPVQWAAAIDDLAWTSDGPALMDGTPVEALVRLRRLDRLADGESPDVIQLGESGAGTLKFDQEITGWPADGIAKIYTRFGRLIEVIHYSGIVVADGQTTVTVDVRGLMGTTPGETSPALLVAPCVAVDSENTETASWTITAVAPGRPHGALLYGDRGAQAQGPLSGPDGATPQVLHEGENVHLLLGEGWSSLYVDTVLVWRCLRHGDHGEANGLYIPSEWTVTTGAVSGDASGPGSVDAVDSDTIYLCVNGGRRVLIDLDTMTITAGAWEGGAEIDAKAEQDGELSRFGGMMFLGWDPAREDYRPYLQVSADGTVQVATAIVETLSTVEVAALWSS